MHMEVLHISCNMCNRDLPDMYALGLWAYISGNPSCPCYNYYMYACMYVCMYVCVYVHMYVCVYIIL